MRHVPVSTAAVPKAASLRLIFIISPKSDAMFFKSSVVYCEQAPLCEQFGLLTSVSVKRRGFVTHFGDRRRPGKGDWTSKAKLEACCVAGASDKQVLRHAQGLASPDQQGDAGHTCRANFALTKFSKGWASGPHHRQLASL